MPRKLENPIKAVLMVSKPTGLVLEADWSLCVMMTNGVTLSLSISPALCNISPSPAPPPTNIEKSKTQIL